MGKPKHPGGRPREYSEELRAVSIQLPVSLLEKLDLLSEASGLSRQRLVIQMLRPTVESCVKMVLRDVSKH